MKVFKNEDVCKRFETGNPLDNYNEFLNILKIEVGTFFNLCEKAKISSPKSLESRQQSILIKELIHSNFRKLSLELDKYRKNQYKQLRKELQSKKRKKVVNEQ